MREECIKAVSAAAGRDLNQQEAQDIEGRINRAYRQLAADDQKKFLGMTPQERLDAAAQRAAADLKAEMLKKRQRIGLTITAHDRMENYLNSEKARGVGMIEALERRLRDFHDGKSRTSSVWYEGQARANAALGQMLKTLELTAPKVFGLFDNKEGARAMIQELYHLTDPSKPDSSSFLTNPDAIKAAKQGAKEWFDLTENLRQSFNRNGGEVGKLEDWHLPQNWNQNLVFKAGRDRFVNDMMPELNLRRYVNNDGSRMTTQQIKDFLGESWKTIATGGANRADEQTGKGSSMLARRHAEERVIHLKDAAAWGRMQDKYGHSDIFTTMVSHVQRLSRDITLLSAFGPNPDNMFDFWKNKAIAEASNSADPKVMEKSSARGTQLENLYNYVAGKSQPVANRHIAQFFDTWRNVLGSAVLGSAPFTAMKDFGNAAMTAAYNRMPQSQMLLNMFRNHNPIGYSDRMRTYRRAGLALDVYASELNRWGKDALGSLWSRKLNNLTHRLSGMVATDSAKRAAIGTMIYSTMGEAADKYATIKDLPKGMQDILASKGISEPIFQTWKLAQKEDWGWGVDSVLTPEAIRRIPDAQLKKFGDPTELKDQAQTTLLAHALSEMDMVVPYTGAEYGKYIQGLRRGSIRDELTRSVLMFKGFALADMERHFIRGWTMPTGTGKAAYIAGFIALSTIIGAVATQLQEMSQGRDPINMDSQKFWMKSALKGGGFGIYGDFLFQDNTQNYGGGFLDTLSGPQIGMVQQLYNLTIGYAHKKAAGERTDEGANIVRFLKGNLPLQNLWYTRAITDRLIFNRLQEFVNPGWADRSEERALHNYGQRYWWPMLSTTPNRPPDLEKAAGQ